MTNGKQFLIQNQFFKPLETPLVLALDLLEALSSLGLRRGCWSAPILDRTTRSTSKN
jgi:hypothetical protein